MSNKSFNLQAIALKNVLEGLLINEEMQKVIDEYVLKQLTANPLLISKAINKTGLYCIFFREGNKVPFPYNRLLICFPTEKQAVDWCLTNGSEIISMENDYRDGPVVLTIIPHTNKGFYTFGSNPAEMSMIFTERYLSFAFCKKGYKFLLAEHKEKIDWDELNRDFTDYITIGPVIIIIPNDLK